MISSLLTFTAYRRNPRPLKSTEPTYIKYLEIHADSLSARPAKWSILYVHILVFFVQPWANALGRAMKIINSYSKRECCGFVHTEVGFSTSLLCPYKTLPRFTQEQYKLAWTSVVCGWSQMDTTRLKTCLMDQSSSPFPNLLVSSLFFQITRQDIVNISGAWVQSVQALDRNPQTEHLRKMSSERHT